MSASSTSRLALVTGGLGGLGTEICRQLAKAGRRVVAADLPASESRLTGFREAVAEFGDAIGHEAMDVSDHAACAALIGRLEREHGGVDILVNAAGITRDASLRKMTPTQWHELMRVNLDGLFNTCHAVVEGMTSAVMTAGTHSVVSFQSMSASSRSIRQATKNSAGAVA